MFYGGVKTSDLGSRSCVLKHLHGRMIFGPFEKCFHEDTIWRGPRAVIYFILTKQIFLHFYCHGDRFYNQYTNKTGKTKDLDDDVTGVKPKHFIKTGMRCPSGYNQIKKMWDRYRKIARDNLGKEIKPTGYIYLLVQNTVRLKNI